MRRKKKEFHIKKGLYCLYGFAVVSMVGISMWALIMGYAGNAVTTSGESAAGNWGLSFQEEGQLPIGNASVDDLIKYDAYYKSPDAINTDSTNPDAANPEAGAAGNSPDKTIYLTFDAGYENGYTQRILDILKQEEGPAAFFLVGDYIKANPEIVKRMEKDGHIVGNHTMTHPDMAIITDAEDFKKELEDLEELYEETTGHKMKKFYRPPQGKYSIENLKLAKEMGYKTFFWSLAHVDWYVDNQPTREEALNILNSRIHNGAIVLLHSTSKTNCEILEELIKGWKEEGYRFESIEKIPAM